MNKLTHFVFPALASCCLPFSLPSMAAEGGYSNYVPGFYGDLALAVEPEQGLAIRNDFYFYDAEADRSVRSGLVELEVELEISLDYFSILYKTDQKVLGAGYAFGATFVAGKIDISGKIAIEPLTQDFSDDKTSYGDITFVPAIFYWNNDDKLHFTQSFYIVAPVGDYDDSDSANIGLNYWTFETDFAMTYFNQETGQDYSIVLGYGYNTENDDTDYKSGDEVHIDYVFNQFLSESLAVGLHGFFYRQVSGDSGDGALLGDFKAKSSGIGPAIMWIPPRYEGEVAFVAKWLHEYDSDNRIDGNHVFLSFMMSL